MFGKLKFVREERKEAKREERKRKKEERKVERKKGRKIILSTCSGSDTFKKVYI